MKYLFVSDDKVILNLKLSLGEWDKGPFSNPEELKRACKKVIDIEPFLGDFMLMNSGELKRGHRKGLHTKCKSIDVKSFLDEDYHLHGGPREVTYLFKKGKKIVTEDYPQKSHNLHPVYTLGGLYEILPNQKYTTKVNAIRNQLEEHGYNEELEHFDNSLVENKRLKFLLLEHLYKRTISNQ